MPVRISGMSLFQHRIKPEWEDDVNKHGGELKINFKSNLPFLQKIWEKLVFSVVTDTFDNAQMLSGIRLLDKSVSGRENIFRIEIWTKFDNSQASLVQALQSHLETEYISMMQEDIGTRPVNNRANHMNPADWISQFLNHSKEESGTSRPNPPRAPRPT